MIETLDSLRQQALAADAMKAEQEAATRAQSKNAILADLEKGSQKRVELQIQAADLKARISQMYHEIATASAESKKILEEVIPATEQDEAFEDQEALRARAITLLRKEAKVLADALEGKNRLLEAARQQDHAVETEINAILGKAKGYLGEREIPHRRMNEIWRYVEAERATHKQLDGYRKHAAREAPNFVAYHVSHNGSSYQSESVLKTPDGQVAYTYEEGRQYVWGIPKEIFINPRFYNEYVKGFKAGLDEFLEGGGWRDKRLSPEQIEQIKLASCRINYHKKNHPEADNEVLVYDGNKPLAQAIPQNPFLTTLTSGERKVIEESITNHESRENLEKRLRLSEYREDVRDALVAEAKAENESYNQKALAEKLPLLQAEMDKANEALNNSETKVKTLQETKALLEKTIQLLGKINFNREHLSRYQFSQSTAESKKKNLEAQRKALPKTIFGNVKDKQQDEVLARAIFAEEQHIVECQKNIKSGQSELTQLENPLSRLAEKLESLRPGLVGKARASVRNGERDSEVAKLESEIYKAKSEVGETKERINSLAWAKSEWERGQNLSLSLSEILEKRLR